jgi:hypothetical protein
MAWKTDVSEANQLQQAAGWQLQIWINMLNVVFQSRKLISTRLFTFNTACSLFIFTYAFILTFKLIAVLPSLLLIS